MTRLANRPRCRHLWTLPWVETHLVWDCILALVFSLLPKYFNPAFGDESRRGDVMTIFVFRQQIRKDISNFVELVQHTERTFHHLTTRSRQTSP